MGGEDGVAPAVALHLGARSVKAVPVSFGDHPLHDVQGRLGKRLITPFATLLLLSGIYLASDRDLWDQTWVTVPLVILIVILGLGGAFFSPRERRLARLAERDLGPQRDGALSDE